MDTRIVTHVQKEHGRIVELFGSGWGPVKEETAIGEIDQRTWRYLVQGLEDPPKHNPIYPVDSMYGKYLRTRPNPKRRNLGDLPEPKVPRRIVTHVQKEDGRIAELFGSGWGPVNEKDAIDEIEQRNRRYLVEDLKAPEHNPIYVVSGKYLRTGPKPKGRNLSDLPEPS